MFHRIIILLAACGLAVWPLISSASAESTHAARHVSSHGVSLSYSTSLARSVTVSDLSMRVNSNGGMIPGRAAIFGGYSVPGSPYFPPIIWVLPTDLRRYRGIFGVEGHGGMAPQIRQLQALLRARPRLSTVRSLPYVLPATDESELLAAKKRYISFGNGVGVSFVTAMSTPAQPVTNATPVRWEFRGITRNGKYLVAAEFPLHVPGLAKTQPKLGIRKQAALMRGWTKYIATVRTKLERLPDSRYHPSLGILDALARTIKIQK